MQRHLFRKPAAVALGVIGALFATALWAMFAPSQSEALGGLLLLANAPVALPEMKAIIEALQKSFSDFKTINDDRLSRVEKGAASSDFESKLAKVQEDIAAALDLKKTVEMLESKQNMLGMIGAGAKGQDPDKVAYKSAFFDRFVRKGHDGADIRSLEAKAMNITTGADGGFAVPEVMDREIERLSRDISPMRQLARIIQVGTSDYRKLVRTSGPGSGWVGETDPRGETTTAKYAEVTPYMGEIYANPQITQQALDDVFFDAEADILDQLLEEFAVAEGAAFFTGSGVKKPKGLLAYGSLAQADGVRPFGSLEYIPTGVAGAFAASNPTDIFMVVIQALKQAHRAGSKWCMAKAVLFEIMKMRDGNGNYMWQPKLTDNGLGLNLLGFPVVEAEDMPAKAANSLSIAFGNFQKGYYIVDRMGTRMLRDPYSNKPFVGFYTTKRVGGMLVNSETIKLLKFSAT